MKKASLVWLGLCIIASAAHAENVPVHEEVEQKSTQAGPQHLMGHWELIYQDVDKKRLKGRVSLAEHQYWVFYEDGTMLNIAPPEDVPLEEVADYVDGYDQSTTFSFIDEGMIKIVRQPKIDEEIILTFFIHGDISQKILPDAPLLKKGDLVFTYLTAKGRPYMRRFLRETQIPGID